MPEIPESSPPAKPDSATIGEARRRSVAPRRKRYPIVSVIRT